MRELLDFLRHHAGIASSLGSDLEFHIRQKDRRPKPRRGFYVVKDWDGTGIRTNRQWRGGREKLVRNVGLNHGPSGEVQQKLTAFVFTHR
jgi:hypothetical protein